MSGSNKDVPPQSDRDVPELLSLKEPADSHDPVTNEADSSDKDNVVVSTQEWKGLRKRIEKIEQELERSREQPVHDGIYCDGCYPGDRKGGKEIVGVRFVCLDCDNFDLCSSCEEQGVETGGHRRSHNMGKIKKPLRCFWCFYSSKSHLNTFSGMSKSFKPEHVCTVVFLFMVLVMLILKFLSES